MFTDKQHPKLTPFSSYKKAVKTMLTVFLFLVSFGVHAGASICSGVVPPASLRSDAVAAFPWTGWQLSLEYAA